MDIGVTFLLGRMDSTGSGRVNDSSLGLSDMLKISLPDAQNWAHVTGDKEYLDKAYGILSQAASQLGDKEPVSIPMAGGYSILYGWGVWLTGQLKPGAGEPKAEDKLRVLEGVDAVSKKLNLWEHQREAITAALLAPWWRCIEQLPTGSGKSRVIAGLILTYRRLMGDMGPWWVLAPNKQLCRQLRGELGAWGVGDVEALTYGQLPNRVPWPTGKGLTLSGLIGDEVHTGVTRTRLASLLSIRTKFRLGLSATPLLRSNGANSLVIGAFGPLVNSLTIDDLSNIGILPNVRIVQF